MTFVRTLGIGLGVWTILFLTSFFFAGFFDRSASSLSGLMQGSIAIILFCVGAAFGKQTGIILWTHQLVPISWWVGVGVIADWFFRIPFVGMRIFWSMGYWLIWVAFTAGALFVVRRKNTKSRSRWNPISVRLR